MNKQEILKLIDQDLSFIKEFLNEYRQEINYEREPQLITLYTDIRQNIENEKIPVSMHNRILNLLKTLEVDVLRLRWNDLGKIHDLNNYKKQSDHVFLELIFVEETYYMLKAINFVNNNIVLVGANGSGKTTFANFIRKQLEATNIGIVIPAQKLLIFPTYTKLPTFKAAFSDYKDRQKECFDDKQTFNDDYPYSLSKLYSGELKILVSALISERLERRNEFCSNAKENDVIHLKDFRSRIDDVIDIWNHLIEHRILFCDNSFNLQIKYAEDEYPAYKMSDGEREIFYVVGRILLAKESSLIIIDEPELHLHKAILNKLWDLLEEMRKDCMFIYLTHDIDFASTRIANKYWLRSYIPTHRVLQKWEIEPINDKNIPDALLMKILGSRKKVLFCEGKQGSLDRQIYEILFPNFTIIPLESCKDVINYTKAYNKIENKYAKAYGIIDRDFRTEDELKKLYDENIFSYNVAEIENLFMMEDFIQEFAKYKHEICDIANIKKEVFNLLKNNKEQQAAFYLTQRINFVFNKSHLKKGHNKTTVNQHFNDFISQIEIENWYNARIKVLNDVIENNDYQKAIMLYNNKGLHSVIEKNLGISLYNKKALKYLKDSEKARQILRTAFSELNEKDALQSYE